MENVIINIDVIFRVITFNGISEVTALFPYEVNDTKGNIVCYSHVGHHSSADYLHCINHSRLATIQEYKELKNELKSIGYELTIIKKRSHKRFIKNYREFLLNSFN
jgi:hypothetical protein